MGKKKFSKQDLIDLLIKKANGFYYTEEIFEYEKPQKTLKPAEKHSIVCRNISFFDDFEVENNNYNSSQKNQILNNEQTNSNKQISETLTLSKKKTSTHFIPPDMLAIKILLEIFEKKVSTTDIEKLNDKELLELKNKLITELTNET